MKCALLAGLALFSLGACETAGEMLVSGTMSGDWKGEALCAPNISLMKLGMTLSMVYLPGGAVTATNDVVLKRDNGTDLSLGAYNLKGTYDYATYKLSLQADGTWSKPSPLPQGQEPPVPPPIETRLDPGNRTISVEGSKSCQPFVLAHS